MITKLLDLGSVCINPIKNKIVLFAAAVRAPMSVVRNKLMKFGDYVSECLPRFVQQVPYQLKVLICDTAYVSVM